jgi:hypothetical protein
MQKTPGRKYQVVEEAEIDLVLQCRDSHEFYERYLQVFPDTRKSLDSISKIWKRKSEFAKKRPLIQSASETGAKCPHDIAALITEQTKIINEIGALSRENLEVNRQILAALALQNQILIGHTGPTGQELAKESGSQIPPLQHPAQKNHLKKKTAEKKTPIIVGS